MSFDNLLDENLNYILDDSYKEILKLDRMLTEEKIPHTLTRSFDGWQVCYPEYSPQARVCDAIEHFGSYGNDIDKLELMGLLTDDERECDGVVGNLTAENIFNRIKAHYMGDERKNTKK